MLLLLLSALLPSAGLAQTSPTYTALEPLPCIPSPPGTPGGITCPGGVGSPQSTFNFQNYVQYIFNLIIAIAAAAAVFMIVFGGLEYMTTESWTSKGAGLSKVKNALYGLLLVLASYLILRTIDPRLVAIPTTLVAPLNINYRDYGSLTDFFSQLEADARAYHADMNTFKANRDRAEAQQKAANEEITRLNQEIRLSLDQNLTDAQIEELCRNPMPEISSLCTRRNVKREEIKTAQGAFTLNTAIAVMRATIQHCGVTTATPDCFSNIGDQGDITQIYNKYNPQLGPAEKIQLNQYLIFSRNWLTINRALNKNNADSDWRGVEIALPLLLQAVARYQSNPLADPAVSADMQRSRDLIIQQLSTVNKAYYPPKH